MAPPVEPTSSPYVIADSSSAALAGLAMILALALGGCAVDTVATDFAKSSPITGSIELAAVVASTPRTPDCTRLTALLDVSAKTMAELEARAKKEREEPPRSLTRAFVRLVGPDGAGVSALEELAKERARAQQYNSTLGDQGCPKVDLDDRIAKERLAIGHDAPPAPPPISFPSVSPDDLEPPPVSRDG